MEISTITIPINSIYTFAQIQNSTHQSIGLYDAFKSSITPIFFEIGKLLSWCSISYGTYYVIQMRYTEGINRIKWAMIGYIILRMTDSFMTLTDSIATNISTNINIIK